MNKLSNWLFFVVITVLFSSVASSATLDDIRKSTTAAKSNISTAHIIYFLSTKHPRLTPENNTHLAGLDEPNRKVAELILNMTYEIDTVIDCNKEKAKSVWNDFCDMAELRKQYNLPKRTKANFPDNHAVFIKNNYEMVFNFPHDYEEPNNGWITLKKQQGPVGYYLDLPYFGIVAPHLLDEKYNPVVTKMSRDGQELIQINISYKTDNYTRLGVIIFDPRIQYRFRSIVWTNGDGEKTSEIIADDYKDINGIPYPFSYISRRFVNGELDREENYIFQQVQFNVALNDLDFKILIPPNTPLIDSAISNKMTVIGLERFMGIDDALTIGRNIAQNQ